MGYSTTYTLQAEYYNAATPDEALRKLQEISEGAQHCLTENGETRDSGKWYDHTDDLLKLSRLYPHLLFTLEGSGEEQGDQWKKYFVNGKVQIEKAEIQIASFDPAKLGGVKV